MAKGEPPRAVPGSKFQEAVGMNVPGQEARVFENALFSQNTGATDPGSPVGSRITKINECLERCKDRPKLVIPFEMIAEDVEYYSKHSLYCKFLGLRVSLQFLENWAQKVWEPEGEMEVTLLVNNFFMVTFLCMADRNRVFESGPYFYNQVGLFVKPWHAGFNPSEELPNRVPVWVRLPKFPIECCREDVLHMLASMLEKPVGPSSQTLGKKVMTFARICVELDLSRPLPDAVEMCAGSHSWVQQLDYETLPFRCRLCHEYGHLVRRCPKAKSVEQQFSPPSRDIPSADKGKKPVVGEGKDAEGFVQVKARNRNRGQKRTLRERQEEDTFNRFEILDELGQPEVNPGLIIEDEHAGDSRMGTISSIPPADSHGEPAMPMVTDGQTGVQMILEPNVELGQGVENVSILAQTAAPESDKRGKSSPHLGILQKDGKKGVSEKNVKMGRKKDLEKIKMIGETLVESGSVKTLDSHFSTPSK
ncbi:uncharacterized protein LOC131030678 [Cryptomeria japonica]|uniref:uncharacterized protein LOC131030678 n=1 Tax=Cryptomeria japonica TaxID=3369 RepID=UPI0027DA04CE|nr:uncharacterized protein LOC131030678 [Cryptomeria japonica]